MIRHLFVYGTLRRDSPMPIAQMLQKHTTLVGPAKIPGRLYQLDAYPGIIDAAGADDWVYGQLLGLNDPEMIVPVLDDYEGCAAGLFERRAVDVEGTQAWVYFWRGAVEEANRIVDGVFLPAGRGSGR